MNRVITNALTVKRLQQARDKERFYLEKIMNNVPFAILSVDVTGAMLRSNDLFDRHIASCDPALIGEAFLNQNWGMALKSLFEKRNAFYQNDDDEYGLPDERKLIIQREDGVKRLWLWRRIINPQDLSLLFIGEDITEREEWEEKTRSIQKMEALGYMAGGMAHELNNVFQPIVLSCDLLESKMDHADDEAIQRNFERIRRHLKHGERIIQDVLNFSRKSAYTDEKGDVKAMMEDTLSYIETTLSESIVIQKEWPADLSGIKARIDPKNMVLILRNLMQNAADSMNHSGVIKVTFEHYPSMMSDTKSTSTLEITVSDTGAGMDKETLDKIFQPFFTTKSVGEGTGLGLPVVYNIVKQMDGDIKVESTKGSGSVFSVFLPLKD